MTQPKNCTLGVNTTIKLNNITITTDSLIAVLAQNEQFLDCDTIALNEWYDAFVGVWCAKGATVITGPICFWDSKFAPIRYKSTDTIFWTSARLKWIYAFCIANPCKSSRRRHSMYRRTQLFFTTCWIFNSINTHAIMAQHVTYLIINHIITAQLVILDAL